jgi:hypothetical protein
MASCETFCIKIATSVAGLQYGFLFNMNGVWLSSTVVGWMAAESMMTLGYYV